VVANINPRSIINRTAKEDDEMASATESVSGMKTGLQFASELVIPGGSNLINGDYKAAGIHAVLGCIAGALFGTPGLVLVAANSFTKATTGRSLVEHLNVGEPAAKK
jgi:hypothetical protein